MLNPLPFKLTNADNTRMKLREIHRRLQGVDGGGVSANDLPTLPGVQSLSIACRFIEGGRVAFIEFMQMAVLNEIDCAKKWWLVFAELTPAERAVVSLDDVCAASGVRPSELMANIVATAMEYGNDVGNLIHASMHPGIVIQGAKSAKRIGGDHAAIALRDREMMFQHAGFLPSGKTVAPVNVNVNNTATASSNAASMAAARATPSLPMFSSTMRSVGRVRHGVQQQITGDVPADTAPLEELPVREAVVVPGATDAE